MVTLRQKKLARNLGKSRTLQEAMIKSDYSPTTAHQQTNITKSKGWNELLEKHLPDKDLLTATKEGLKAEKIVALPDEPNVVLPDHAIRLKAAEQGYKLKGRYADVTINQQFNAEEMKIEFE